MKFGNPTDYGNVDLGPATVDDIATSVKFVQDMKDSGWQLPDRFGQDEHRDPLELRNNQFQGKVAEFMVYRWLQLQGIETLKEPTIDAWKKGESDPGYDFEMKKVDGNIFRLEVKSGGEKSRNLALEVQKWGVEDGPDGTPKLKYNVPKEKVHGGRNMSPSAFVFVSVSSNFDAKNITATIASGKIIGGVYPTMVIDAIEHWTDSVNNVFPKGNRIFGKPLQVSNYVWGTRVTKQRGSKFHMINPDELFEWIFKVLRK